MQSAGLVVVSGVEDLDAAIAICESRLGASHYPLVVVGDIYSYIDIHLQTTYHYVVCMDVERKFGTGWDMYPVVHL